MLAVCATTWASVFVLPSGAATTGNDGCGYAASTFNESYILRWAQLNGSGLTSTFGTYVNDEKGLLLGVNGPTPMSGAAQNGSNGQSGGASYHAFGASGGSATAADPSGRPYFPALYITNLTAHPLNADGTGAGDFQHGGAPRNVSGGVPFVDDVFGTWATATVTGSTYSVTAPLDKNNWNLGTGSDNPVGTSFSAMGNEGYGAEVRWSVGDLADSDGHTLAPGSTYRVQVIIHDGDQNKTGGDSGEFCTTLSIPQASPALTTSAGNGAAGGTIQDQATLSGGANPTGKIAWNVYASSDSSCSSPLNAQPSTLTTVVTGNGTFNSPAYTPASAGTYKWVATYSGDSANKRISTACNDPNEVSTVGKTPPTLTTNAVSATVGQPITDDAHLTGGSNPTGTITWNVYASSDTTCATPLNSQPSTLTATVTGNGDYTSPGYTPSGAGSYQWVARYSGDGNNTSVSTACGDPNEVSQVTQSAAPSISLRKTERTGSASFTHGPITGDVGGPVDYRMLVTNTGNTTLVITFMDNPCDSGTLSGPSVVSGTYDAAKRLLSSGGELLYTCSHVLAAGDQPYTNTASVSGQPPSGPPVTAQDSVKAYADTPGIKVVKLQRDGTSGTFTSSQIAASVGDTIYYKIQVTNTGNVPLALSLSDDPCDAGTTQGPVSIRGILSGNTLSAGGVAQYTCSHVATASDIPRYINTAVVTGQPPSGPRVTGTGIVIANIARAGIQVVKLEKVAGSGGGFTRGPLTVTEQSGHYVVHTIDYEIQVTNTGSVRLALNLKDARCAAGTIQGPALITGTLTGGLLSPGGRAQYTCSHRYVKREPTPFTNVATVTGTPPFGPAVTGTSRVSVRRHMVQAKHACRSLSTGRLIRYTGHSKPRACLPNKPHHHVGFTG